MEIISQDNPKSVFVASAVLKLGGIIVYPTDTLYGFGGDATNPIAINKINTIKNRVGPMSVLAADFKIAFAWININQKYFKVIGRYLGGNKTLIVPVQSNIVNKIILGKNNSLGIRIPDNQFCNKLAKYFGKPIISTSVNRSGEKPLNDPQQIENQFSSKIDLLIDGGTLPESTGSKIYQFKDNKIITLRN